MPRKIRGFESHPFRQFLVTHCRLAVKKDWNPTRPFRIIANKTTHYEPLEALATGTSDPERIPSRLGSARCDGWSGVGYDAGTGRYRLCAGFGGSRNLWAVCHDRALASVRGVWSQSYSCARAGFVSGPRDSRRRAPSLGWRRYACGNPREHDGGGLGSGVRVDRCVAPGICHGAALQADSLRLHERHRAHSADQPAAEALWVLHRWRRSIARPRAHYRRHPRRTGELDVIRNRRRHTRSDSSAQALQTHPGSSARGRRRDYRRRYTEPRLYRWREGSRAASARTAIGGMAENGV